MNRVPLEVFLRRSTLVFQIAACLLSSAVSAIAQTSARKIDSLASGSQGLKAMYFKSEPDAPFSRLGNVTVEKDLNLGDLVSRLADAVGGSSDNTAARWTGRLRFPDSGEFTLYLIGDNGFRLWLDGKLVVDHWEGDHDVEQQSVPIRVEAGSEHDLKVEYFNATGGANLRLSWSSASTPRQLIPSESFLLPKPALDKEDLAFFVEDARRTSETAKSGTQVGAYPPAALEGFRAALVQASAFVDKSDASADEIKTAVKDLARSKAEFAAAVIREPFDAKGTGNPVLPGYWADPTVFYDKDSDAFYCFATVDGVDAGWQHDTHFARSKDMVTWELLPLELPAEWRRPVPGNPLAVWAPSIMKHPTNGKYYLIYFVEGKTYVAYADSPMGPWKSATKGTTPETSYLCDAFDAQFFVDTDGKVYLSHAATEFKLSRLKFAEDYTVSFDNDDPHMTEGGECKYKTIFKIDHFGEGTALYKKDGTYYLLFAEYGSQKYRVGYATAPDVWGPYTAGAGLVMQRDDARDILGPGHVSVFEYKGDTYIAYHRQHFPFSDSKRQTCVNRLIVGDGKIVPDVQNHSGLRAGSGALEKRVARALKSREKNLALGKATLASSVSDFKGGVFAGEEFLPISRFYESRFAVDDNWGTRWAAGAEQSEPSWLIVDLGVDTAVGRTETVFEHVRRLHRYKIDFLQKADADGLAEAAKSNEWKPFADRTNNEQTESPLIDKKKVVARFLRITILSADLPTARESTSPARTDYLNRVSIVEFGVFAGKGK